MRIDKQNSMAFDTAVAVAQATAIYGDVINNVKAGSPKDELYLVGTVREAITSDGSATVAVTVYHADDSALSTNAQTIVSTGALAKTVLVAGYRLFAVRLPMALRQYIGAKTTVATADLTGGKIDIVLVDGVDFAGM